MNTPYRLHYAPDNASLIVRLTLEEMEQPYDAVLVDRRKRAQRSAEYLQLNPAGLIPVLETPDGPIFETGAILLWLADRHGGMAPAPDSPQRATFLKWLFFTSNTVHSGMRLLFYSEQYVGPDRAHQEGLRGHVHGQLSHHLAALDAAAAARPAWFGGAARSVLDFYVACLLRWMVLYPVGGCDWFDLSKWPHLQAMAARLEPCASVRRAIDAEGLGPHPFTAPRYANPPEGFAS
ncbi:glutathione S-transferase family protein [Roseovarius sp. CAU 1744]|uniref:glutathione S-transferase family protein n=1 Tax=Roseovarius sp. CAU 1744 TaxID=3140368 RepID=UPI00325B58E3